MGPRRAGGAAAVDPTRPTWERGRVQVTFTRGGDTRRADGAAERPPMGGQSADRRPRRLPEGRSSRDLVVEFVGAEQTFRVEPRPTFTSRRPEQEIVLKAASGSAVVQGGRKTTVALLQRRFMTYGAQSSKRGATKLVGAIIDASRT